MSHAPVLRPTRLRRIGTGRATSALALALLLPALGACEGGASALATEPDPVPAQFGRSNKKRVASVTPSTASIGAGQTVQLTATDPHGETVSASWSTSDPAVAVVSGDGLVTGVGAGPAVITATSGGRSATASITVTAPAPSAPAGDASVCGGEAPLRVVRVASAGELSAALKSAQPGDRIELADGVYAGSFSARVSGSAEHRISLCGTGGAVLRGSSTGSGYGFYLNASYWTLKGFTVTNSQFGIYAVGASHNVLDDLTIEGVGQEAVRFRSFSSHNTLQNSRIRNTGLSNPEYGEGVYIGSWKGHWDTNSNGAPDASDFNRVVGNVFGPDVRAEHIDAKEGTTGGVIRENNFDGRGMVASQTWIDSWVEITGNGYTVSDNTGSDAIRDGFQVTIGLQGWGNDNTFHANTATVRASGYGFRIASGASGTVVGCDNAVRDALSGFANVGCR